MTKSSSKPRFPDASPAYPAAMEKLIAELNRLPGIGRRSAERLAFHLLKAETPEALALADAVAEVKRSVKHCPVCYNLSEEGLCRVCADTQRDRSTVLVVEQPRDLIAIEQTSMYRGLYHVLMGRLSPLDGIGPGELTVAPLLERIDNPQKHQPGAEPVREVVLGLGPNTEGDGTSLYLAEALKARPVSVTRLARGLPTGSTLEHANKAVLADAIQGRRSMEQ